ncbi:ubiquitin-related domain-containing protein [Hygrophoropsis aurantiaca]|uniref:Ubiquitin-related domain-containing protein n=1 Tax=Hygrophoropsis aurantiaca TaxID=72124 RepID=A0ACB8AGN2_9AGAM|nr:ubiquitin-related domain-containing protein [Hygrophoropsis aurantiaca]
MSSPDSSSHAPDAAASASPVSHSSPPAPPVAHGSTNPFPPSAFAAGPYLSASARTSFTRVDVDSVGGGGIGINANLGDSANSNVETESQVPQTPQVSLTFLLVSGRRRTMSFEPETTVGRVKELVWNAWLAEWQDERPPAPSYLRILYLGKILQDEDTLAHLAFPTHLPSSIPPTPTIVHLSIRSFAPQSEDPALSKKRRLSTALGSSFAATRRASLRRTRRGTSDTEATGAEGRTEEESTGCCSGCVIC